MVLLTIVSHFPATIFISANREFLLSRKRSPDRTRMHQICRSCRSSDAFAIVPFLHINTDNNTINYRQVSTHLLKKESTS